ncbi:NrfD/PsrC family molybdoenzyme membrane anchor subunit [Desulfitobacterium sp. Sab5]|uniref:NrfD/PsrC family molybdoenzyme membrane anchor subunit n=1 Tax=Desulfitobacterium nosdiversum TaxID=3375356 RepID=UPI003CEA6434
MSKKTVKTGTIWISFLVLIMAIAFGVWIRQLRLGLEVTAMNNYVSWGLYIITFAFLVGLSAGGLIVSSTAYIFKLKRLEQMAPVGIIAAVACVIGAGGMVFVDVGHPERVLNILFGSGRITSPLKWDFFILSAYLLLGVSELYVLFGKKWNNKPEAQRERMLRWAAYIGLPVAILVHSITAWIFGLQIGRPYWNTALMAPIFISSAVVSGVGLLLIIAYAGQRSGQEVPGLDEQNRAFLTKLLSSFILVDAFFLFCDLFTSAYSGGTFEASAVARVLSGSLSPIFWVELICGVALPFLLLVHSKTKKSLGYQALAGVLVVLGVFFKRINIILPGFLQLNVPYSPGVSTGHFIPAQGAFSSVADKSSFTVIGHYFPSVSEILITLGVLAMVAFLITIGVKLTLNMNQSEQVFKDVHVGEEL